MTRKSAEEPRGTEEEQERLEGNFVITRSRRDAMQLLETLVRKFIYWFIPTELQKA